MSRSITICLVGAGRVAKVHANSLMNHVNKGIIDSVVDKDLKVLKETADAFGIDHAYSSFEEALEKRDFDAVVISTPTFTHAPIALAAARANKHIFLEKPMALTLNECDLIIREVNNNNVILQVGFMRRFSPEFVSAAKRIQAGEIGEPMMIKSLTHGPGLPPAWARDLDTSNGLLAEVNSHDWDCVRWLMGSNFDRVYTEVANFKGEKRGVETDNFYDNAMVNLHFDSGGLGSISGVCPCDYGYDARVEIIGEKGIMQIGSMNSKAIVTCTNRNQGLVAPVHQTWPQRFEWAYIYEMKHFVECVQKQDPPKVGGDDGRWAVAGVLAATKSFLEGRPVEISELEEMKT